MGGAKTVGKESLSPAAKRALVELQRRFKKVKARVDEMERSRSEPIAIIGMGCRFPGGGHDPRSFWRSLRRRVCAVQEIPGDRWDVDGYYDPDPNAPGKMYTRRASFLESVDGFDPEFFGISPREAEGMDPQQRLLLEVCWEALEDAGCPTDTLIDTDVGVFQGVMFDDYHNLQVKLGVERIITNTTTGIHRAVVTGRLSYLLGLQGPSMVIDSACSSSLVAVHLACQSLRTGECTMALAGGVNLILSPEQFILSSKAGMLAPDGCCKTFDARADGFGRGEGCGVVVLRRLSDALANRENILALVKGSAVNQDGSSSSLTAPNGPAQQAVIRKALTSARVDPSSVGFIEAHGTGTSLGDPIELRSLGEFLGDGRSGDSRLAVGSAKTNIGHLEGAAGVAGLIKVVQCLQHEELMPHVGLEQVNPHIALEELPLALTGERVPWIAVDGPRVAGLSSLGFSGTNAHLVLQEAPSAASALGAPDGAPVADRPQHVLALSARSDEALGELAARYGRRLEDEPSLDLGDFCFSANVGRSHLKVRAAVVADTRQQALERLGKLVREQKAPGVVIGAGGRRAVEGVAFLFSGQGSQYAGMGKDLYDTQPTFRRALDRCAEILQPLLDRPLLEVMHGAENSAQIDETGYTQPALFALEWALSETWRSWGIEPSVVLGHSVGELVAACVAGVFSLEDGLRLIAERGKLMQALPPGGQMAAVFAPEEQVGEAVAGRDDVSIAAVNGPRTQVISGAGAGVEAALEELKAAGVKWKRLRVSHAFHSSLMDPMLDRFEEVAGSLSYSQPKIRLISNVTGEDAGEEISTGRYWRRHVREAVRFSDGMRALARHGCGVMLEVGPAPVLLGMGRRCIEDDGAAWLPSLRPGKADWHQLQVSLAEYYVRGGRVDWAGFDSDYSRQRVPLPTYPFQRKRYWLAGMREVVGGIEGMQDWLYEVSWRPVPRGESLAADGGRWLILTDDRGVGRRVAALLEERGQDHVLVTPGARYSAPADGKGQIDPNHKEDYARLLADVDGPGWARVLHLWSLDAVPATIRSLPSSTERGCGSALLLVQALAGLQLSDPPRLWIVTRGAQATSSDDEIPGVAQAPAWGLGRVVRIEHPDLWGGLIDLDPADDAAASGEALTEAAAGAGREDELAIRGGGFLAPRLTRMPATQAELPTDLIRRDGSYLVTGGLGGLGLEVSRWLARHGAGQLVLVGRRGLVGDEARKTLAELEEAGSAVLVVQGDVSSVEDVDGILSRIPEAMPLRGVIHAAGVLDDGVLAGQDWSRFERVFASKVRGAWNLHEATAELPLDLFVMFSSQAALLGASGQGNYAAGNAFLDALAHHRKRAGLPGLSLGWGAWEEVGMAAALGEEDARRMRRLGVVGMPVKGALASMERALTVDLAHLGILRVEWERFVNEATPARSEPFLSEVAGPPRQQGEDDPAGDDAGSLAQRLSGEHPDRRRELLVDHVLALVAELLGYDERTLDPGQPLMSLGLDSLMAMNLRNALGLDLEFVLPATLALDHPTVEAIAAYVEQEVFKGLAAVASEARTGRGVRADTAEPVAIVGLGCRFPGGATDPSAFWRNLQQGVDVIGEVPPDRWKNDEYFDRNSGVPGKINSRYGGFLEDVDQFDPLFFGITPREAEAMDPQQRLLLEVSWEALEHAGLVPAQLAGSRTGVFTGLYFNDYQMLMADTTSIGPYSGAGFAHSAAAGRLSFLLGLHGPAIVVDTACSSSLVALHLAFQSLRGGESDLALAAGVSLNLGPLNAIMLANLSLLSPSGRCRTFDASADGIGRGEGCGVVVLKRLSDAEAAGDRILAVVRGTAVNQDGRSSALTAPSGPAQEAVVREALEVAGLEPRDVSGVETHGTGTPLGDPMEVQALRAVFGRERADEQPLVLGSVKANIGHQEAAAGVAGLIKGVLSLQHEELPPQINLRQVNPHVPLGDVPAVIPSQRTPWLRGAGRRIIGVSSFGFIGTNAHAIIEEAPDPGLAPPPARERPRHILALSARSDPALAALADRYAAQLGESRDALADICYSANTGRAHHEHRLAVVSAESDEAIRQLSDFSGGRAAAAESGTSPGRRAPRVAFLFTGQGAQYAGMGRQLYQTQPVFARAMDHCAEVLGEHLERPLLEVIHGRDDAGLINETAYTQPALFALEFSLCELWRSWGVTPSVVLGHSVGEVTAACVAGVFDLEDGLMLISGRGRLMQDLPAGGAMAAVFADHARAEAAVADHLDAVSIAASNGPRSQVVSGEASAVEAVVQELRAGGVKCRPLNVSHAFHSPLMDPMLDSFEQLASRVRYSPPRISLISNLAGAEAGNDVCSGGYWRRHVRESVQFARGMAALVARGCDLLLEIGPSPTLIGMGQQCVDPDGMAWLTSLRKDREDWDQILESLGQLYTAGAAVDWKEFDREYSRRRVDLPTYPFQRRRYWLSGGAAAPRPRRSEGEFLGASVVSSTVQIYEARWRSDSPSFLAEHRIHGMVVIPGAAYLDLVLEASATSFGDGPRQLEEVVFEKPLIFHSADEERVVQVMLMPAGGGNTFQVISRPAGDEDLEDGWVVHVAGHVGRGEPVAAEISDADQLASVKSRVGGALDLSDYYQGLLESGLEYGPAFRRVEQLFGGEGEALGRLSYPGSISSETGAHHIFPGLLDSCFQVIGASWPAEVWRESSVEPHIPFGVERFAVFRRAGEELWCHVVHRAESDPTREAFTVDLRMFDGSGAVVGVMTGLHLKRAPRAALLKQSGQRIEQLLYAEQWQPREPGTAPGAGGAADGSWIIFADRGGVGTRLAREIEGRGGRPVVVTSGRGYDDAGQGRYQIDPGRPEDMRRVIDAERAGGRGLAGVVHLWGLDGAGEAESTAEVLAATLENACGSLLHLVQELGKDHAASGGPRLWLVTRGAQAVIPGADVSPCLAPAWGLGRVIALEQPELGCVRIDLDRTIATDEAALLVREILNADGEEEVAFRGGERRTRRLVRLDRAPDEEAPVLVGDEGSYLVTGGLGGIGRRLTRWLVEHGARHVVLADREGGDVSEILEGLAADATVEVAQGDISNDDEVRALVARFGDVYPRLRGVFHLAGVIDDALLPRQRWAGFGRVMGPKLWGAWSLDRAVRGLALDHFVMFSSQAALMGNVGQANYAAANAFLDGLAHHRRSMGEPALAINWGPWEEVGMAVDVVADRRGARLGTGSLQPEEALAALEAVLSSGAPQAGVLPTDWRRYADSFPAGEAPAILQDLARRGGVRDVPAGGGREELTPLGARLERLPRSERLPGLVAFVKEQVEHLLGRDLSGPGDTARNLMDMGVDSIMAIDFRNALRGALGCPIPATLIYDYPTVEDSAGYLAAELFGAEEAAPVEVRSPGAPLPEGGLVLDDLIADIEQLTPEQAMDELKKSKH